MRTHKVASNRLEIVAGPGGIQYGLNSTLNVRLSIAGTNDAYVVFGDELGESAVRRRVRKDGALRLNIRGKFDGQARPAKALEAKSSGIHGVDKIASGEYGQCILFQQLAVIFKGG
jgi:hypothetical protein